MNKTNLVCNWMGFEAGSFDYINEIIRQEWEAAVGMETALVAFGAYGDAPIGQNVSEFNEQKDLIGEIWYEYEQFLMDIEVEFA